jgi:hypothetical protein
MGNIVPVYNSTNNRIVVMFTLSLSPLPPLPLRRHPPTNVVFSLFFVAISSFPPFFVWLIVVLGRLMGRTRVVDVLIAYQIKRGHCRLRRRRPRCHRKPLSSSSHPPRLFADR